MCEKVILCSRRTQGFELLLSSPSSYTYEIDLDDYNLHGIVLFHVVQWPRVQDMDI